MIRTTPFMGYEAITGHEKVYLFYFIFLYIIARYQ